MGVFDRVDEVISKHLAGAEIVRVCRAGKRVTVADVHTRTAEQAEAFDRLERFRDPSHTHALRLDEFDDLFQQLSDRRTAFYRSEAPVEGLLSRSFPKAGGADAFRQMVEADIGVDAIGIGAKRLDDSQLAFTFPVAIISGIKRCKP